MVVCWPNSLVKIVLIINDETPHVGNSSRERRPHDHVMNCVLICLFANGDSEDV